MSQAALAHRPYTNSNLFTSHYLDERIHDRDEWNCDDGAQAALTELQALYDLEKDLVDGYAEDPLIDNWIDEVLDILGYGTNVETTVPDRGGFIDILLFEDTGARRDAVKVSLDTHESSDRFDHGIGLVEAKQWDADFSARVNDQRPYRNASHQIKHHLERTPENIQWGILTNGRKWRLYGTNDYETQTYYEVDLPELLERGDLKAFKYFYTFFRPAAFHERGGTTFLDDVWSESETAAQQLGADLQDNVFTALRVLGKGFIETNDLALDPDGDGRNELKEQSLVLLYRLIFLLYAESRGLIHPENQAAVDEYEQNFSLDALRLEIHDEIGEVDDGFDDVYSEHSTTMWHRLENLFRLIDEGEESLGIPPYNGGLFNQETHSFLTDHEISDQYLAEVIYRVSTTENDDGRYVLADYADLDTRHLGSVYEGLLEHQFRIAPEEYAAVEADGGQVWRPATEVAVADAVETVEEGDLYVVNDEGERKATGAYYTPDYVVTYIVEETVGPLVDEIRADLEEQGFEPGSYEYLGAFYRRVTNLNVLDPAMGSGHFLTRATEYLSRQVMDEVLDVEEATAFDEHHVRREIAKECIYGLDLNGMAVELAKLSMWLETLAADHPLAFLDHHLKTGNSLVGSDVTTVLAKDAEANGGQLTLQQSSAHVRERTPDYVMDLMQELLKIDNETLEDVKSMEELYEDVRSDAFYQRLFELTNVHTAEQFGLDVPEGAYEQMAQVIDDETAWAEVSEEDWFTTAQAMSEQESFFHWELEFPEVFFTIDGEKLEDGGFDAVIGNPPWVILSDDLQRAYLWREYDYQSGQPDLYRFFIEKCSDLSQYRYGLITPSSWLRIPAATALRESLITPQLLESVAKVPSDAFPEVAANMVTFVATLTETQEAIRVDSLDDSNPPSTDHWISYPTHIADEYRIPLAHGGSSELAIVEKMGDSGVTLGDIGTSTVGYQLYHTDIHSADTIQDESHHSDTPVDDDFVPEIRAGSLYRFYVDPEPDGYVDLSAEFFRIPPETYRDGDRILVREVPGPDGIVSAQTSDELLFPKSVISLVTDSSVSTRYLTALLNSNLLAFEFLVTGEKSSQDLFPRISGSALQRLSIHDTPASVFLQEQTPIRAALSDLQERTDLDDGICDDPIETILEALSAVMKRCGTERQTVNCSLLDYLGTYADGHSLSEVGLVQPPEGATDSSLTETAEDRDNLRIGDVKLLRESPTSVEIRLTVRYKPDTEDVHETDQWGYTETDFEPALRISDLTETEADLIEAFVPVAVDEAGGFANFRETATTTMSPLDRLRTLTLPAVDDVRDGLESYRKTTARAAELETTMERTNELIDQIVYELYGLTDEEIAIVEEAVGD
ncbi:N-6 DNA methylase [Halobacteria archaeon AArc-dxtr1]|nr:N-6 DNA methylase [Halobacteria archaeon AArc-dxtr1]